MEVAPPHKLLTLLTLLLLRDGTDKSDEIAEKFQTAFDPPPSFSENYIAIFFGKRPKKAINKGPKSAI